MQNDADRQVPEIEEDTIPEEVRNNDVYRALNEMVKINMSTLKELSNKERVAKSKTSKRYYKKKLDSLRSETISYILNLERINEKYRTPSEQSKTGES